mmetsp:Transcript_13676/g.30175  ORF Transcript_13676/g.30175 Transcript_13676/m.30175 type:complete len:135 (+) Transcript_13676:3340-3744(+)
MTAEGGQGGSRKVVGIGRGGVAEIATMGSSRAAMMEEESADDAAGAKTPLAGRSGKEMPVCSSMEAAAVIGGDRTKGMGGQTPGVGATGDVSAPVDIGRSVVVRDIARSEVSPQKRKDEGGRIGRNGEGRRGDK